MLRKLGLRMTLLNLLISGAILVAMALLALGIAEGTVSVQYENDLAMYARSMVVMAQRAAFTRNGLYLETPDRYSVLIKRENDDALLTVGEPLDENIVQRLDTKAQVMLSDAEGEAVPLLEFSGQLEFGRVTGANAVWFNATSAQPVLMEDEVGNMYRITAWKVEFNDAQDVLFVAQNREGEIAAKHRMRWLFGGCVAGGLFLIFLASIFYSRRAIRPIEASIRQQRAFIAAASHELRTPVAALRANAEVLADAPVGDEYAPYLESVTGISRRLGILISDMMELARADMGDLSVRKALVDADEVAMDAVRHMRPLAERKGVTIREDIAPAVMAGDPDRLRQVLLALLDNAVRHTPAGGEVFVSVRRDGRHVHVGVADTGEGIPDEHKPHVFERFYRIDKARDRESGGFGLGLNIAWQLAAQMEGTIALSDRPGGGALFALRFKAAES